jgi:tRNA-2-methylthio-N6-dimethylallyladenosine synthase
MKNVKAMPSLKEAKLRRNLDVETIHYKLNDKYQNLGKGKKYYIYTYGCQGNEADSEVMAGILEGIGYVEAIDPLDADLVLLNTCAIRENAEQRIWGVLGQLKGRKRDNPDLLVGICGCMPQEESATNKIINSYDVDIIFSTHNRDHLPELIYDAYMTKAKVVEVLSNEGNILEDAPKHRKSKHKAWVSIMYGCDEFCTYCIVPYTRGRERSRSKDDIIKEVKELVQEGYKEVTLLGQNVNAYGKDKYDDYSFGDLLQDLDKIGIDRIKYTTSHPRDFDEKTINAMATCKHVIPWLHLPVQSGDDDILKSMNRKYTMERYHYIIDELKRRVPGIAITTDIIVGFPNETDEQFNHTLDLVRYCEFDGAYTFVYSPREGTPAAKMKDNVTPEEKDQRRYKLNDLINEYALKGNERFIGEVVEVLVDGESKNGLDMMCGYTRHNKLCHFKAKNKDIVGTEVKVKVTEAKTWFIVGELCDE